MNEKQGFVIEDLDDYHLVIKADDEWRVRKELETEVRVPQQRPIPLSSIFNSCQLEKNTYSLE